MTPAFYVLNTGGQMTPIDDFHPVNGIETSDGSFVLAGKGLETSGQPEAFAIKLSSTGAYQASWKSNIVGGDAANAVIQLPSGGDLLVAGWRTVGGVGYRCVTKLRLADLSEVWTARFDDTSGANGALEMITLATDGVVLAGLKNKPGPAVCELVATCHPTSLTLCVGQI